MSTSSGLTEDARTRTNTSLAPTSTGHLALLVNTRSSTVPYEWACHAIILDDTAFRTTAIASAASSAPMAAAAAVNVRRTTAPARNAFFDGGTDNGRNTERIDFDMIARAVFQSPDVSIISFLWSGLPLNAIGPLSKSTLAINNYYYCVIASFSPIARAAGTGMFSRSKRDTTHSRARNVVIIIVRDFNNFVNFPPPPCVKIVILIFPNNER